MGILSKNVSFVFDFVAILFSLGKVLVVVNDLGALNRLQQKDIIRVKLERYHKSQTRKISFNSSGKDITRVKLDRYRRSKTGKISSKSSWKDIIKVKL